MGFFQIFFRLIVLQGILVSSFVFAENPDHALQTKAELSSVEKESWQSTLKRYIEATEAGIELLRDSKTALTADRVRWDKKDGKEFMSELGKTTSPTNIALDLLLLLEKNDHVLIKKMLQSLEKMEIHPESKLFFGWYNTETLSAQKKNISSVDNIHLALAFWTLSQKSKDSEIKAQSKKFFEQMNFDMFIDRAKTPWKLRGNFVYSEPKENNSKGTWSPDGYYFDFFGSEARTIAALIPALSLSVVDGRRLDLKGDLFASSMKKEVIGTKEHEKMMTLWDGGLFQLYLPQLLMNEKKYSPELSGYFENTSDEMHKNMHSVKEVSVPRAHSASGFWDKNELQYSGAFGVWNLVSSQHKVWVPHATRERFEKVFTPHALALSAEFNSKKVAEAFTALENAKFSSDFPLFNQERGWLDGLHVDKDKSGTVVQGQYILDQFMLSLALRKALAKDQKLKVNESLEQPEIQSKLQSYYEAIKKQPSTPLFAD